MEIPRFIKLTRFENSGPAHMRADKIGVVSSRRPTGSRVYIVGDAFPWEVSDSPEEVLKQIADSGVEAAGKIAKLESSVEDLRQQEHYLADKLAKAQARIKELFDSNNNLKLASVERSQALIDFAQGRIDPAELAQIFEIDDDIPFAEKLKDLIKETPDEKAN